jgi:hypothetical protein
MPGSFRQNGAVIGGLQLISNAFPSTSAEMREANHTACVDNRFACKGASCWCIRISVSTRYIDSLAAVGLSW